MSMKVRALLAIKEATRLAIKSNYTLVDSENPDSGYVRDDFPSEKHKRAFRSSYAGSWPAVTLGGTTYTPIEMRVPDIYVDEEVGVTSGLKYLEWILTNYPNALVVVGVWNRDGSQLGTHYEQVENGVDSFENSDRVVTMVDQQEIDIDATIALGTGELVYKTVQVEQVDYVPNGTFTDVPHYDTVQVGTPVYPIHPQFMKIMPPDVTYNPDGSVASSTPAVAPKEVYKPSGWGDRNWEL